MEKMLNVSIVLYKADFSQISDLVQELKANKLIHQIYLIDNSPLRNDQFTSLTPNYVFTGKNIGFGAAHNIAIQKTICEGTKYHLVINPDIYIQNSILVDLINYLEANSSVGQISPMIFNQDGTIQFLPKLLPAPMDLLIRVVPFLKKIYRIRSRRYVLADYQNKAINVPIISGCFSIFNVEILKNIGFYDDKFFMYFEDFDLSRRIHEKYKTVYYPFVSVVHLHERGAAKSIRLFVIFIRSAFHYFNKHGWIFDNHRNQFNKEVLKQLNL